MVKVSIRTKLITLMLAVVVFFLAGYIILSTVLLEPYYQRMKKNELEDSFSVISALDFSSKDIITHLESMEEQRGIQVLILDEHRRVFFCSHRYDKLFLPMNGAINDPEAKWFREWMLPKDSDSGNFEIFSSEPMIGKRYNDSLAVEYLSLYGRLDFELESGDIAKYYIIINTSMTVIEESANAANSLAFLLCAFMLVLVGIATFIIATRFTTPIVELCDSTQRLAKLDFSRKIEVQNDDELGLLTQSINHLSDELESKIGELRKANEQLKLDIEELDRVDRKRSELISNISHDLKTPLSIILGYCEALQSCDDADDREYYCTVIEDEVMRMSSLASRLLKLEELETGANALALSTFDLSDIAGSRLEKFKYITTERNINAVFVGCDDALVTADRERIEEVLDNLLTNAYNHTPDGGEVYVNIFTDNGEVSCRVYNSGSSIPEDSISRIWDSFYMVDKARTRKHGGAGLGLKIVSTILDCHGGEYGVSNVDGGVAFYFILKQAKSDQ